jgi:hypothetical protein
MPGWTGQTENKMHICHEEIFLMMSALPVISWVVANIRAKIRRVKPMAQIHREQYR